MRRFCSVSAVLLFYLCPTFLILHAQQASGKQELFVLDHATSFIALADGVAVADGSAREEITAMRDDVIRVRIAPNGTMPENASWASAAERPIALPPLFEGAAMSDAEHFRREASRARRLAKEFVDQLTRERLTRLAEDYLAQAIELESGDRTAPPAIDPTE